MSSASQHPTLDMMEVLLRWDVGAEVIRYLPWRQRLSLRSVCTALYDSCNYSLSEYLSECILAPNVRLAPLYYEVSMAAVMEANPELDVRTLVHLLKTTTKTSDKKTTSRRSAFADHIFDVLSSARLRVVAWPRWCPVLQLLEKWPHSYDLDAGWRKADEGGSEIALSRQGTDTAESFHSEERIVPIGLSQFFRHNVILCEGMPRRSTDETVEDALSSFDDRAGRMLAYDDAFFTKLLCKPVARPQLRYVQLVSGQLEREAKERQAKVIALYSRVRASVSAASAYNLAKPELEMVASTEIAKLRAAGELVDSDASLGHPWVGSCEIALVSLQLWRKDGDPGLLAELAPLQHWANFGLDVPKHIIVSDIGNEERPSHISAFHRQGWFPPQIDSLTLTKCSTLIRIHKAVFQTMEIVDNYGLTCIRLISLPKLAQIDANFALLQLNLEEIRLHDLPSLVHIDSDFARSCASLKFVSITACDNLQVLGANFCGKCTKLISLTLPQSLKATGASFAEECQSLLDVDISGCPLQVLGSGFAVGCESLRSIALPRSLTLIGDDVFRRCKKLKSLDIHKSKVTTIGGRFCGNCDQLEHVRLPATLSAVGSFAFELCRSLKKLKLQKTVLRVAGENFAEGTPAKLHGKISFPSGFALSTPIATGYVGTQDSLVNHPKKSAVPQNARAFNAMHNIAGDGYGTNVSLFTSGDEPAWVSSSGNFDRRGSRPVLSSDIGSLAQQMSISSVSSSDNSPSKRSKNPTRRPSDKSGPLPSLDSAPSPLDAAASEPINSGRKGNRKKRKD